MKLRRLRTFTLWTGTTLCVLIAAAFVASGWWLLSFQVPTRYGPVLNVTGGLFTLYFGEGRSAVLVAEGLPGSGPRWRWWNSWYASTDRRSFFIPLYALFAATAIPTVLVWRFWPKPPVKPGHCRCGYDLRGNESGVCPECGVEVPS